MCDICAHSTLYFVNAVLLSKHTLKNYLLIVYLIFKKMCTQLKKITISTEIDSGVAKKFGARANSVVARNFGAPRAHFLTFWRQFGTPDHRRPGWRPPAPRYATGNRERSNAYEIITLMCSIVYIHEMIKGGARRGLTEARLTEARFTEATCGIPCARFRALVRPKRAQDSLRHERLRSCLTEARAHERWTRIYWKLHDLWNLIFHSLGGQLDSNPDHDEFNNRHFEFHQYTNCV